MHRFFISPDCINDGMVNLSGDVARQLGRVLRSRPGDRIVVLDDSGFEYQVTLRSVNTDHVAGTITDRLPSKGEPSAVIALYQGLLKADRFEFVLQKGTELGVSAFVPISCARSVPRASAGPPAANRYTRWRRIITEAAEQSCRGRLPTLAGPVQFFQACDAVDGPAIIPWEAEGTTGLEAALDRWKLDGRDVSSVGVFIGPEGGFAQEEIDYARSRGIAPVSLGNRILRAETAGMVAVSAILYELGELGG